MARYLVQSLYTGQFLCAHPERGDVQWTQSLTAALRYGVAYDEDEVAQLIEDHCEKGAAVAVDLDA